MVHVRASLYSLLQPRRKKGSVVNLLGHFAPLLDECELYALLRQIGVKTIHELSRCRDFDEYLTMAEANFNLVLHPEARFAARDFEQRLNIPSIELTRLYQIDRIHRQYQALGQALGVTLEDGAFLAEAERTAQRFAARHPGLRFAVGECMNGDPFELSLALTRQGFEVEEIYGTISAENFVFLTKLAQISPNTRIYSNLEPTMLYYDCSAAQVDVTIGKDAGYYHPGCPNLTWNQDVQPFGYAGVRAFYQALDTLLSGEGEA